MPVSQPSNRAALQDSTLNALQKLIDVVAQLRSPEGGCPWDLAQTPETLIPYVIEEAYEVVDAIRGGDKDAIAEELGDLLLQVVLQAQIATEYNDFTLAEVAEGIAEKLIRRHPHVFGDVEVNSAEEVHRNWQQIKAAEKGNNGDEAAKLSTKLQRYARILPPLTGGMKISRKAAGAGFEWENIDGVWEKFREELEEFQHAIAHEDQSRQQEELGDLLFVIINLARWHDLDPATALHDTNHRFVRRFALVEELAPKPISECTLAEFEQVWQEAKAKLKATGNQDGET